MFSSTRFLVRRALTQQQQPFKRLLSTTTARMALTQEQVAIVKSTAPVLKQHGEAITTYFYKSMLGAHPELKNIFSLRNQQTGAQQRALAGAVLAYAQHIDDLGKLSGAVERIAHKHAALFVEPSQYAIVGEHLIKAIGAVLGDAATPEIAGAWTAAYGQLADVFIGREKQLYEAPGADVPMGWRKFKIAKKVAETPSVASFFLEPLDGSPLPSYLPGQYLSLQVPVPQVEGLYQSRQFSLSEAQTVGNKYYRVSVKREPTTPNAPVEDITSGKITGLVTNILHDLYNEGDVVELSRPQGDFFVDVTDASKAAAPAVLISAGVGVTPLRAILDSMLEGETSVMKERPITWIQASRNKEHECFGDHIRAVKQAKPNVNAKIFYDVVSDSDVKGRDYDFAQELELDVLDKDADLHVGKDGAQYFVCGPVEWMMGVRAKLEALGVPRESILLELFGTGTVPE